MYLYYTHDDVLDIEDAEEGGVDAAADGDADTNAAPDKVEETAADDDGVVVLAIFKYNCKK